MKVKDRIASLELSLATPTSMMSGSFPRTSIDSSLDEETNPTAGGCTFIKEKYDNDNDDNGNDIDSNYTDDKDEDSDLSYDDDKSNDSDNDNNNLATIVSNRDTMPFRILKTTKKNHKKNDKNIQCSKRNLYSELSYMINGKVTSQYI